MRARIKRISEIDPALICCGVRYEDIQTHGGRVFEVEPSVYPRVVCYGCGNVETTPNFTILKPYPGQPVPSWLVDLDEGEGVES